MATRADIPAELETAPLSPTIGVEIRGVDLSRPLDAATGAAKAGVLGVIIICCCPRLAVA